MARYDYQLKIKAVEQYTKSTTTLKQLAKKYKVKDPKTIKEWVDVNAKIRMYKSGQIKMYK